MTALNGENVSLTILHRQIATALEEVTESLADGQADEALLNEITTLCRERKELPERVLILLDRTESTDDDMAAIQSTLESLQTKIGKADCTVICFGDASVSTITIWDGVKKIKSIKYDGCGNRHEGAIQALDIYLNGQNINLASRAEDPSTKRIEAYVITDELPDGDAGSLNKFPEVPREVIDDFYGSVTPDDLHAKMLTYKRANIHLSAFTPKENKTDYSGAPIHFLGQVWQMLARFTGGQWQELGSTPQAVSTISASTALAMKRAQNILQLSARTGTTNNVVMNM